MSTNAASPLQALHVVASVNRDIGGPAVSVPELCAGLERSGVGASLATLDYAMHGPQLRPAGVRVEALPADALARNFRGWSPAFERLLAGRAAAASLVHDHGLWMFTNLYARRGAQAARVPLVISPRGMLEPWAMAHSPLRKAVIWRLFQRRNLDAAALLHATSDAEVASIRARGFAQPVARIPNGVALPELAQLPGPEPLARRFPELAGRRWLLFMSRLHAKKGLAELVGAWKQAAPRFADWHLVIAGPDLDGHGEAIRARVAAEGLAARTTFTGMLSGELHASALANAGLLVLPTHSENFGIVVAEALAHGTPVLTTRGAPWSELPARGCGWWIELNEASLAGTLAEALALAPAQLKEMGARGRALVAENYSWDRAARAMKAAYLWLLKRGPRPDCVQQA